MDVFEARFSRSLFDLLEGRIADETDKLVSTAAPDHAGYMARVGFIRGIKAAMGEARELEAQMSKPEATSETRAPRQGYET